MIVETGWLCGGGWGGRRGAVLAGCADHVFGRESGDRGVERIGEHVKSDAMINR